MGEGEQDPLDGGTVRVAPILPHRLVTRWMKSRVSSGHISPAINLTNELACDSRIWMLKDGQKKAKGRVIEIVTGEGVSSTRRTWGKESGAHGR